MTGRTMPAGRVAAAGRVAVAARIALAAVVAACASPGAPPVPGTPPSTPAGAAADAAAPGQAGARRAADPPIGREVAEALEYPPLRFRPPAAGRFELSNGVTVFYMEDRSLPLVDVFAQFRGGPSQFGRVDLAAATAIGSSLLLNGGTASLPPDSVDGIIDFYALSPQFGTGGSVSFSAIGSLRRHFDIALDLWAEMLRAPRFDSVRVETWRLRELETVRRTQDQPASIAIAEFNRVMFGDHPVGWIMEPADLEPERLSPARLRRVHGEIYCRDNLTLGIVGDLSREEARSRLERAFGDLPACPRKLELPPVPRIRREGGVVVVHKEVNQSSVVMGQAGGILQDDDPEYFAAQVANWILGGSGFSSRILSRIRTGEGLAYSAGSVWTAGRRHERVFGAFTQTKSESTIAAAILLRELLEEARRVAPTAEEVRLAVDNTVNGFVFAFQRPADVVGRQMAYRASGLPEDWLERYLAGVQRVTPRAVLDVVRRHIRPEDFTIIIVGDTTKFDAPPGTLGPRIPR